MRIRTHKLKAPSPITVLLICLIWPLAAVVGATMSEAQREHAATLDSQSEIQSVEVRSVEVQPVEVKTEAKINAEQKEQDWRPLTKLRALTLANK